MRIEACGGGRNRTYFRTLIQALLVLLRLADARGVALELAGAVEGRKAIDAGHRGMAHLVVLFELRLLHGVPAS